MKPIMPVQMSSKMIFANDEMILLFRNDCHMWWISNSWNVPAVWKTMALDNI